VSGPVTPDAVRGPGDPVWTQHYDPTVPSHVAIPSRNLPDAIEESVRTWPNRTAFIHYGARISYAQFWELTGRFAATLTRDGFRPGDRLALYLPNCPAHPIALLGALRIGVTAVQVSPLYIAQDLSHLLSDAQPKGIVTLEILYPNIEKLPPNDRPGLAYVARFRDFYPAHLRPFVNFVLRRRKLSTRYPTGPEVHPWRQAVAAAGPFSPNPVDPQQSVAVFQYTGGTTGVPKAAMLSHRNLLANALQCRAWFNTLPAGTSTVLAAIPFFHIYGLTVALTYPLLEGATIVLQTRPDPDEVLKLIRRYRPSEFPGVPSFYQAINHHPDVAKYDIRSIRVCVSGSAPLPLEVARRFEELTGGHVIEGYGLTEASPVTHANPIFGERRTGSVGLPVPETDQKVVDLETGTRTLGPGERGEIAVRGPQVMLGYYHRPDETAMVLRDGWLYTGDVGYIDSDGYAFIVDRKKDMIDVGGMKVYPREVEEVLLQHPGIRDAAAVGVPDERLGEVVHAVVVPNAGTTLTPKDVIDFVRERIAHYKAPRTVEFRTVLPRSGVQKVLRRTLRDDASRAMGGATPTAPARADPSQ